MKKYRLKITREDFDNLKQHVFANFPNEAGAFALAGMASCDNQVDILIRRIINIPQELIPVANEYHLEVSPKAINGIISLCESNKLGVVICHSHPKGLIYSPSDDYGENRLVNSIRQFIQKGAPIASLLLTPEDITGRIWLPGEKKPIMLDEIIIVGDYFHKIKKIENRHENKFDLEIYDRQVRAFGAEGQKLISQAKVGIIGVGGTGSPIAEQLARLGVTDFKLIDPDHISPSNITRVYGTSSNSVKKLLRHSDFKVNIISAHLKNINPNIHVQVINQNVVLNQSCTSLIDRDIIFLCTDEHWGRSVVNQFCYQYLIPTINLGVRVTSDAGKISNAIGVLDVLQPGKPCLWCKQFLRSERIATESMPRRNYSGLKQEGYVEDIYTLEPSVISFTSSVASTAVSIFIQFMTNFMGKTGNISRISWDFLTGLTSRGTTNINTSCICQHVKGYGDLLLLPTVNHVTK